MQAVALPIDRRPRVIASPVASLGNVKFASPVASLGSVRFGETQRVTVPASPEQAKRWADYTPTPGAGGDPTSILYPSTPTPHAASAWMQQAPPMQAFAMAAVTEEDAKSGTASVHPQEIVGGQLFRSLFNGLSGDEDEEEEDFPTDLPYNVKNTFIDDLKGEDEEALQSLGARSEPAYMFAQRSRIRQGLPHEVGAKSAPAPAVIKQARIINASDVAPTPPQQMAPQIVTTKLPAQTAPLSPQTMTMTMMPATQTIQAQPTTQVIQAQPTTQVIQAQPTTQVIQAQPTTQVMQAQPTTQVMQAPPGQMMQLQPGQVMQTQTMMMPAQPYTMVMVPQQQTGSPSAQAPTASMMMPYGMAPAASAMGPSAMAPAAMPATMTGMPATVTGMPATVTQLAPATATTSMTAPASAAVPAGVVPLHLRQPTPSVGSTLHGTGNCRPCAWYWKPQGCANVADCRHCHLCPEGELKNRKKDKVQQMRGTTTR